MGLQLSWLPNWFQQGLMVEVASLRGRNSCADTVNYRSKYQGEIYEGFKRDRIIQEIKEGYNEKL